MMRVEGDDERDPRDDPPGDDGAARTALVLLAIAAYWTRLSVMSEQRAA
jgi:hypothetical protein